MHKKHQGKKRLKKSLHQHSALIHEIHHIIKSRYKAINSPHEKQIQKFRKKKTVPKLLKSIVHNFLSYNLTQEEHDTLS